MSSEQQVKPTRFFARHPVFRYHEFLEVHAGRGGRSRQTTAAVLKQHVAAGNLVHLRRGLYATVPRGGDPRAHHVDPYLVATKLAEDALVAYHSALQFHGRAYSVWNRFQYLTRRRQRRFTFRDLEFIPMLAPATIRSRTDLGGGVREHRHAGGVVRVSTLERTMVDVLDEPEQSGGWEEVWRSLEMVEFFDFDAVLAYTRALGSALTAGRVGLFLEQHREPLMVESHHLDAVRELAPAQPQYLDARRQPGKLVAGWNLVVPEHILERAWAEVL